MNFMTKLSFPLALLVVLSSCYAKQQHSAASVKAIDVSLQNIGDTICQEIVSGKMWQVERGGKFFSPGDARRYAEDLSLGGFNDWRLPTREEMLSLYTIFFYAKEGNCAMKSGRDYWTLSEGGESALGHWEDYLLCGPEFKFVESLKAQGYVRAVRP